MSGVLPVGEDEDGVRFAVLQAEGSAFLGGAEVGAGLAEFAEGGRVPAGFRAEVTAEAEHVRPGPEPPVRVQGVEVLAGLDESACVVGDLVAVEFGEFADAAVEGAGVLGGLGGVLGDVGGDSLFGDVGAVTEGLDRADVELGAPPEGPGGLVVGGGHGDRGVGVRGGGLDRVGEQAGGGPGRGGVSGPSGPSRRITAWKCRAPRFWNSATLPYETRTCSASSRRVSPARAAISRRRRVVKRCHRSPAWLLKRTAAA